MKIPKISVDNYRSYSRDEQRVLHVISVIAQPKSLSEVKQVLRKLNWQTVDGILLSEVLSTKLRVRLVSDGILIFKLNKMHCHWNIAEFITRITVKEHTFVEILSVVESLFPEPELKKSYSYSYNYEALKLSRQRKIRNAFYLNDEETLLQQLEISHDIDLHTLDYDKVGYFNSVMHDSV